MAVDRIQELATVPDSFEIVEVPVRSWHRVYLANDSFETPNPGYGSTRSAPFPDEVSNVQVPTMYLAESLAAALLETVFHNVDTTSGAGVVAHRDLHGRLHAEVLPPAALRFVDLRDGELTRLGLGRPQLTTSAAEHYPCTRAVAQTLHGWDTEVDGLLWHSRQAEQQGLDPTEVAVVFCDRVAVARGSWQLAPTQTALGALLEGAGLTAVNVIASQLGLTLAGDEF